MPLISAAIDTFLLASLSTTLVWSYLQRRPESRPPASHLPYAQQHTFLRRALNVLFLLHTLYILWTLLVCAPPNLFRRLNVPLTTPSEQLRLLLLKEAGLDLDASAQNAVASRTAKQLPFDVELLLTKLSSVDGRKFYTRFGQVALQTCVYCNSASHYALFGLPHPLLAYLSEAIVLSFFTVAGSGKERWRTYALGLVACAAIAEGYVLLIHTADTRIPKDGRGVIMWHDTLFALRQILFIALPAILAYLSISPSNIPPLASLPYTLAALEQTLTRIHLLRLTRGAIMRQPALHKRAAEWWLRQAQEGEWARQDQGVRSTAEKLGLGYDATGPESDADADVDAPAQGRSSEAGNRTKLRTNARTVVQTLMQGLRSGSGK